SPMTSCDEPYIGDESIRRPPAAKKARITSAHCARAAASRPTLKVIQLPRPTAGTRSPLEGIKRSRSAGTALGCASTGHARAAPHAASRRKHCRRSIEAMPRLCEPLLARASAALESARAQGAEELGDL